MSVESQEQDISYSLHKLSFRRRSYKELRKPSADTRRLQAAQASKDSRASVLQAKRLRRGAFVQHLPVADGEASATSPGKASVPSLVDAVYKAAGNPGVRLGAVRSLRRLLSTDDPPHQALLQAGVAQCLCKVLQQQQQTANDLKLLLEATWAITNLAAGPPECVEAALHAAPILVVLLQSSSSRQIAEQSAWALGNMAGESAAVRLRLQANGAVRPLLRLVLPAQADPTQQAISAAATAAWALSSMLQGNASAVKEVIAVRNGAQGLLQLLGSELQELVVEIAWVICHMTHGQETDLNRLVHLGMVTVVMQLCHKCVQQLSDNTDSPSAGLGLLQPLLRTLANVAACGGRDAYAALLTPTTVAELTGIIKFCLEAGDEGLQSEAAWMCANLSAAHDKYGDGVTGPQTVMQSSILDALQDILADGGLHARREAAYAFANLLKGVDDMSCGTISNDLMSQHGLSGINSLLRSGDEEMAMIGLQLLDLVAEKVPMHVQKVQDCLVHNSADLARAGAQIRTASAQLHARLS